MHTDNGDDPSSSRYVWRSAGNNSDGGEWRGALAFGLISRHGIHDISMLSVISSIFTLANISSCPSKIKGGQISEVRVVKYVKGNCIVVCLKENFNRGRNTKSEISDWDVEVIGYERDRNDIMCEYEAK